jgi:uncharacterized membrane protein YGL010W
MRARLDEYATFHTTSGNEVCHFFGIPLIVAGFGGIFGLLPLFSLGDFSVTVTEILLVLIALFYLIEARVLGFITAFLIALLAELGRFAPVYASVAAFVIGWAVQFIGHAVYEHRSPAFLRNLLHLLVGPAWLVERAAGK